MTDQDRDTPLRWPPRPGDSLSNGRYLLLDRLSQGSFIEVWAGLDQDTERSVALKILAPEAAQDDAHLLAFEQEARTLAGLDHPGVVRLLALVGVEADGRRFFAMELLDGQAIHFGGRPLADVLGLFDKILEVLAHVHARGLVHLALQPENIMMLHHGGWDNEGYPLKLLDFGIAHIGETLQARLEARAANGDAGEPLGSARYLSPEQARGDHASVGPASDLYSLGVMLHEAITGRCPFEGDTWPVVLAHLYQTPTPPTMAGLVPDALEPLQALVASLLSKSYITRPDSAADVRRRLASIQSRIPNGGPTTPMPGSAGDITTPEATRIQLPAWGEDELTTAHGVPAFVEREPSGLTLSPAWLRPQPEPEALSADPSEPWPLRYTRDLPSFGRETHQATMGRLVEEAVQGRASGIILTGERGSGKRRLARWLVESCREQGLARVLTLDLNARGDLFSAFRLAIYRHLRQPLEEKAPLRERIDAVLSFEQDEQTKRLVRFLYESAAGQAQRPEGWRGLWRRTLRQIAVRPTPKPLLLWLDGGTETTWRDAAAWTVELLQMARSESIGLVFVWSPHQNALVQEALDALLVDERAHEIHLQPLETSASRQLIRYLEPSLGEPLVDLLVESCGGNPNHLRETLQGWRESEALYKAAGGLTVSEQTARMLTASVGEALHQRLSSFLGRSKTPTAVERALKLLALIGPLFTQRQVGWCLGNVAEITPLTMMQERWLTPRPLGREPHLTFMDEALRHFIVANARDRGELGGLVPTCVEILLRGALDAQIIHDWEVARHNLSTALLLLERWPPPQTSELQLQVLDALARVGYGQRDSQVTRAWAHALALQTDVAPSELRPRYKAASGLWYGCTAILEGDDDMALSHLQPVADTPSAPFSAAVALHSLSEIALRRQEMLHAEGLMQKARNLLKTLSDTGDSDGYVSRLLSLTRADATLKLAAFYDAKNNHGLSTRLLNRALKSYQAEFDLDGEARAYTQLTRSLRQRLEQDPSPSDTEVARVRRCWNRLQALTSSLNDEAARGAVAWEGAGIAQLEGDFERAAEHYSAAANAFSHAGNLTGEAMCHNHLGQLALARNRAETSLVHHTRFRDIARQLGNQHFESTALTNMAWAARQMGDTAQAGASFEQALAALGEHSPTRDRIGATIGCAEIAASNNELPKAVELLKAAQKLAGEDPVEDRASREALERIKDDLRESPSLLARAVRKLAAHMLPLKQAE